MGVAAAVASVVAIAVAYVHMISTGSASRDDFAAAAERVSGAAPTPFKRIWGYVAQASGRETQALAVLVGAALGLLQIAVVALFVGAALSCSEAVRRSLQLRREAEATHGTAFTGLDQP